MSEYMFGASRQRLSAEGAEHFHQVAKKHGAYLVEYVHPGTRQYQRWFGCVNSPSAERLAKQVYNDLCEQGLCIRESDGSCEAAPKWLVGGAS